MASVQQARPSQAAQMLPNEVVSEQQSLVVVKKLLAIAVSGITYLRGIFPGKAYGVKYIEDEKVMILKGHPDCSGTSQIHEWMQGCFDAIEKKYLRAVIVSIYTDPNYPEKVTEYYQFKIHYTTRGTHVDFQSKNKQNLSTITLGNTKKESVLLVRKLYMLMQNLDPLPENISLNMKLAYYDDVTPQDYQPPGFQESEGDTIQFEQEPVKLTMGKVTTPYHSMKVDMATEKHRVEQMEERVSSKEKWILKIDDQMNQSQSSETKDLAEPENLPADVNNTETKTDINEMTEGKKQVTDIVIVKTSNMEMNVKKTRSGRIIKSVTEAAIAVNRAQPIAAKEKTVLQQDILNSQESTDFIPAKKRKFSEPKDHR